MYALATPSTLCMALIASYYNSTGRCFFVCLFAIEISIAEQINFKGVMTAAGVLRNVLRR